MSKIQKALEKARKERAPLSEDAPKQTGKTQSPSVDRSGSFSTSFSRRLALTQTEALTPDYSQTRHVRCDRERLINSRVFSILEKDSAGDQYKLLRTMVLNRTRPLGYNTIVISSFTEGEGKSLTSINLAITIAKDPRQNVLLVDMDLRRPSIHSILGIDPTPGLKDHFLKGTPLADIMIHPGIKRLTILPAGGRMNNSSEIISSKRTENLIHELKHRYPDRFVIFDAPALHACTDPLVLSSYVDALLLVARSNHTTTREITSGMALLEKKKVLGIVLNDTEVRKWRVY